MPSRDAPAPCDGPYDSQMHHAGGDGRQRPAPIRNMPAWATSPHPGNVRYATFASQRSAHEEKTFVRVHHRGPPVRLRQGRSAGSRTTLRRRVLIAGLLRPRTGALRFAEQLRFLPGRARRSAAIRGRAAFRADQRAVQRLRAQEPLRVDAARRVRHLRERQLGARLPRWCGTDQDLLLRPRATG